MQATWVRGSSNVAILGEKSDPLLKVIVSDVSRMRGDLLAAELMRNRPLFRVVGCAVSHAELLELAQCDPDVAIVSGGLREGPLSGFDALRELHVRHPRSRKIMVLDACEQDLVLAAFRGGARGVFSRSNSVEEFVKCVERVHEGQIWAGNTELEFVLGALSSLAPLRVPPIERALSRREEQIAGLVAAGANHHAIARKVNLTEQGVTEALGRIFAKLGIHSRVELVLACRQLGASANGGPTTAPGSVQAAPPEDRTA